VKYAFYLYVFSILASASELTSMQNACESGMSSACYELGSIFSGEEGLKPQLEKSEHYLKKACELDHDKACQLLDTVQKNFLFSSK